MNLQNICYFQYETISWNNRVNEYKVNHISENFSARYSRVACNM